MRTARPEVCLAVDLGAGSGRVMAAALHADDPAELTELHRFANHPVCRDGFLCWDFAELYRQVCAGLSQAARLGYRVRSVGIDTWGVDFGLLGADGKLLAPPLCYRDSHTRGLPEQTWPDTGRRRAHFARSGVQPAEINTLYQLLAMKRTRPELLARAKSLLFMPDLVAYLLTGAKTCEQTIASTSELLRGGSREWDAELMERLGLPAAIFPEVVAPGTVKGTLLPGVARDLGLDPDTVVVAVASHDTASAVHASRMLHPSQRQAFLSSGTWSLLGAVTHGPVCSPEALDQGFTNEAGVDGDNCLLQNIPGMWMLQRLVEKWQRQGTFDGYPALTRQAEEAETDTLIDVDSPDFTAPDDMARAISDHCLASGQAAPRTRGEYARVCLRSLARRYARAVQGLNSLLPDHERLESVNIVGGGSQNDYLNRLTAQATGLRVVPGPVEATAIGNIELQRAALRGHRTLFPNRQHPHIP